MLLCKEASAAHLALVCRHVHHVHEHLLLLGHPMPTGLEPRRPPVQRLLHLRHRRGSVDNNRREHQSVGRDPTGLSLRRCCACAGRNRHSHVCLSRQYAGAGFCASN